MNARARPHVHHLIGGADRVLIVLDHDHRIAQIAQPQQAGQQSGIVALMQANRRLIQHIHHPHQPRADLRGQPDALRFAAGQRIGAALQTQIIQPTLTRKFSRSLISLTILAAISPRRPGSVSCREKFPGDADGRATISGTL
jgi:hypothetical protein